jgi:hypothetical protein
MLTQLREEFPAVRSAKVTAECYNGVLLLDNFLKVYVLFAARFQRVI